jgi:AcrR family transcriptional regulator
LPKVSPRKDQIFAAAALLFRKKGFKATSMRMIAAALGIEASSLYNHIASKQEILAEQLLEIAASFMSGMSEIEHSSLNPIEKLEKLVALHVKLTLAFPDQISLITGEWVHLEEPVLQQYKSLRSEYEFRFKAIIIDGINMGLIENVDPEMALFSILSSLHWLYSWSGRHKEMKATNIENEIKQCLLYGLKKR